MTFYEKFILICNQKGVAPSAIAAKAGFDKSVVTYWKKHNGSSPKLENVYRIANALDVNPADLDDRLAIDLGSDTLFEYDEGNSFTLDSNSIQAHALSVLRLLNPSGQQEWIKRGEEMAKIPEYKIEKKYNPDN